MIVTIFTSGPTAWPYVLTATTPDSGVVSQGAQTFTMNVTNFTNRWSEHLELQKQLLMETGSSDLLKLLAQTVLQYRNF